MKNPDSSLMIIACLSILQLKSLDVLTVFSKVDIYLANELCFEKVQDLILIPVCDIDLYMSQGKLLENLNWKNELRSKFTEDYSLTM